MAAPVAPESTIQPLSAKIDKIYCLKTPEPFFAIGNWYEVFSQTPDEEAIIAFFCKTSVGEKNELS